MVNVPVLRKELEYITTHPDEYNQAGWLYYKTKVDGSCRMIGCLAGLGALHADRAQGRTEIEWDGRKWVSLGTWFQPIDAHTWQDLGMELFGLTAKQAFDLFHEDRSLFEVWQLANIYSDGEIEIPVEVSA